MIDPVVHGVDFSGAQSGGEEKIVVATRGATGEVSIERGVSRSHLVRKIIDSSKEDVVNLWRVDAPFSLPVSVLELHGIESDWLALAQWMRGFESPRAWRRAMRAVDRKEKKRTCDREARTPMAPMNLRVFKQTWTVICEVLLPLAHAGIHLAPIHVTDSNAIVSEGCPASVLLRRGEQARGYKGDGSAHRERRSVMCTRLEEWGVPLDNRSRKCAIEDREGDVIDALLLLSEPTSHVPPAEAGVEAWVW